MICSHVHSRLQRPRSFWSAPRIATSGQVQRHSGFKWLCEHDRLRPEPIRFVTLDSEHARSDVGSVNSGLPVLDQARSFTAVKRLGTRAIYALPVTSGHFPFHHTKFPQSTSFTRAISVLSPIILPLQTFFSRVLLLPPEGPTTTTTEIKT